MHIRTVLTFWKIVGCIAKKLGVQISSLYDIAKPTYMKEFTY